MTWPKVEEYSFKRRRPLKYHVGDEKMETLIVYASTVALDDDSRRLIHAGTILAKITSGAGEGKYGPYSVTASDGRESLTSYQAYVAFAGHDVTLGDKAVEGLFMDCVFDTSEIIDVNAIDDTAGNRTALKTAFPQAHFDEG